MSNGDQSQLRLPFDDLPSQIHTPTILKLRQCFSPSPNKSDYKFQIAKLENELMELEEFTFIENTVTDPDDVSVVTSLDYELKFARVQRVQLEIKAQAQWDLVHQG